MTSARHDPSIHHEPQFKQQVHATDPSEDKAHKILSGEFKGTPVDQLAEHGVWDEPGLSMELSGKPPIDAVTYGRWLNGKVLATSTGYSLLITGVLILLAGPWAIVGSIFTESSAGFTSIFLVCLLAPIVEEIMKIAVPFWVVERRPYLFKSNFQILVCGLAAGVVFAAIENLVHLGPAVFDFSNELTVWRWTACVALHATCSLIASAGIARVWDYAIVHRQRPPISLAYPMIVTAIVIHAVFNTVVTVFGIAMDAV